MFTEWLSRDKYGKQQYETNLIHLSSFPKCAQKKNPPVHYIALITLKPSY